MQTTFNFVYCTCESTEQARLIGKIIVQERLAACANILPSMISLYWWEGQIQEDQETVLVFKTTFELLESLAQRVKELHSYSIPCIIALPIVSGNPDYLEWIRKETLINRNDT